MRISDWSSDVCSYDLWFTLQVMGENALGHAIDHGIALAKALEAQLRSLPGWQIVSPAQLGIVTFRYAPDGQDGDGLDELNTRIARHMIDSNLDRKRVG